MTPLLFVLLVAFAASVVLNVVLARTNRQHKEDVRLAERLAREEAINSIKGMMSGN